LLVPAYDVYEVMNNAGYCPNQQPGLSKHLAFGHRDVRQEDLCLCRACLSKRLVVADQEERILRGQCDLAAHRRAVVGLGVLAW